MGRGPLADAPVQRQALLAQLQHRAQHRIAVGAVATGEQIEGGEHRLGRGVVGLIEHLNAGQLQPAAAAARQCHLQIRESLRRHAQLARHRQGQQQVAGVVATGQGHPHRRPAGQLQAVRGWVISARRFAARGRGGAAGQRTAPLGHPVRRRHIRGKAGQLIGQGHPQHPAAPACGQGRLQQRVAGRDHHQAVRPEGRGDLALGGGDRLAAAQPADVGGADVGDHRHIRLGAQAQPFDLTRPAHAHLHHQGGGGVIGLEHRQRRADVVVLIAAAGHHMPQRRQGGPDQLSRRRLAGRAGHRHHRQAEAAAPLAGEILIRLKGVIHQPQGAAAALRQRDQRCGIDPVALGDGGCGPLQHRGQELMGIETLSHQRHEQAARQLGAAVGAHRSDRQVDPPGSGSGHGITPQLLQVLETQDHQASGTGASRIMPDPTRAPRPRRRP